MAKIMQVPFFLLMVCFFMSLIEQQVVEGASTRAVQDPTHGFTSLPLGESNFAIHKPYDMPVGGRYSFEEGVHKLWVLSSDKPLYKGSPTSPRSEIRIRGYDYLDGVWQFEGHFNVPSGTTRACIMQVFGSNITATTAMLLVIDGALTYYGKRVIIDDIYNKWFRLNVIHDTGAGKVNIFIDGSLRLTENDRGRKDHYFKLGVYSQRSGSSYFMESKWKGIKVLKLAD